MSTNIAFTPSEESTLRYFRVPPGLRTTRLVCYYVGVLIAAGVAVWQFFSTREQDWLLAAIGWFALNIIGVLWSLIQHCSTVARIVAKYDEALSRDARGSANVKPA